jgi:hypothetical protein
MPLIQQTGVTEIHFSAKKFTASTQTRLNHLISFLDYLPNDSGKLITDADVIKRIRKIVE